MPKIPRRGRRKRWTNKKRRKGSTSSHNSADLVDLSNASNSAQDSIVIQSITDAEIEHCSAGDVMHVEVHLAPDPTNLNVPVDVQASCETSCSKQKERPVPYIRVVLVDHNYSTAPSEESQKVESKEAVEEAVQLEDPVPLLLQAREKLLLCLPPFWTPYVDRRGVHVMLMSRQNNKAVQRTIYCSDSGHVELSVHCVSMPIEPYLEGVHPPVCLSAQNVGEFCDRIIQIVAKVRLMEICAGADNQIFREVRSNFNLCEVDNNPYQECRYTRTCHALTCQRLVNSGKWRCKECSSIIPFLRRRYEQARKEKAHLNTRNDYLTSDQKLQKICDQREKIEKQRKAMDYQQKRMQYLLKSEGVNLSKNVSDDLHEILRNATLTPSQSMFLQQQIKASQKKNMCGMRWHPSMIRLALAIYLNSRSTYELIRNTGVIHLPSSRTLYDYSHADVVKEGIDEVVLKSLAEKCDKHEEKGKYKRYHVMGDEMFTSRNLVFNKHTGELVGYMKMNDLDTEIKMLEDYLEDPNKPYEYEQSHKVMTYLVKGVSTSVKEVVATFAVGKSISVKQMYKWTWDVINALERSGVWVVAFTGDGSSTNRAFFKMHTQPENLPMSKLPGNSIYCTVNKAAPHRLLYFIADVPHLLKTIRNCFHNSRLDKKKGTRRLQLNGERIVWNTIFDLYNLKKGDILRKSYKLNAQNVNPDSYSCMRVPLAAQVMSRTVANDIEQQNWPNTKETVRFIRFVNDWFDCLNGAHTYHGKRKNNKRLDPYTDVNDPRFDFLASFVEYLNEWKQQAENLNVPPDETLRSELNSQLNVSEGDPLPLPDDDEDRTPAGKMQISSQSMEGVEITVKSFTSCVKFVLEEGCPYVNAGVFCQDPLEQNFSKLRGGFGGSTNPNLGQILNKQRAIHIQGELGIKRKGNTEGSTDKFQLTEEPLRKRKCLVSLQNLE